MDNPLIQPDPGLYIWTIATFLVLFALLRRYAWRPILQMLEKREEGIRRSLDDAAKAKEELERLQGESQEILATARAEAQSIVADSRSQAEKLKTEMLQEARDRAASIVKAAEEQIQAERAKAISDIRDEVVNISLMVASKLIRKNLTPETERSLIEESLRQIESQ